MSGRNRREEAPPLIGAAQASSVQRSSALIDQGPTRPSSAREVHRLPGAAPIRSYSGGRRNALREARWAVPGAGCPSSPPARQRRGAVMTACLGSGAIYGRTTVARAHRWPLEAGPRLSSQVVVRRRPAAREATCAEERRRRRMRRQAAAARCRQEVAVIRPVARRVRPPPSSRSAGGRQL